MGTSSFELPKFCRLVLCFLGAAGASKLVKINIKLGYKGWCGIHIGIIHNAFYVLCNLLTFNKAAHEYPIYGLFSLLTKPCLDIIGKLVILCLDYTAKSLFLLVCGKS